MDKQKRKGEMEQGNLYGLEEDKHKREGRGPLLIHQAKVYTTTPKQSMTVKHEPNYQPYYQ